MVLRRQCESVTPQPQDRILDWRYELQRLEPHLKGLPRAAREALRATVGSFLQEDAMQLPAPSRFQGDAQLDDAAA